MTAQLTFTLPDEKQEFDVACKGIDLYLSLWDLDIWLRGIAKHGSKEEFSVDLVRDQLREIMQDHNVNLEMMD